MSHFTRPLEVSPLADGKRWRLLSFFTYHVGEYPSSDVVLVPTGFVTDFASVPRFLWVFVSPWGKHGKAAVLHDYLYETGLRSRFESDCLFLEAMRVLGVRCCKRYLMFIAVRIFGAGNYVVLRD